MPADYERAVAFILAHGGGVELRALNELEGGDQYEVPPSSEVKQQLLEGQRPDGGWAPFWANDYSSLDATCYRLAQAEMAHLSLPQTALEFLRSRQQSDGSWEEDESVRDLAPRWAKPGDLEARLYLTANCGWWLINGMAHGEQGYEDEAARAGAYLESHQAEDGSLPSFLQTHWLAAALWIRLEWGQQDVPEQATRTLDYLATQLDDETPAGALGWMLTTLAPLGLSSEHPVIVKAVALLSEQQRPDGGWTSEDGPDRDAWVTMQAMTVLIQWLAFG
jgi:squalene-hopene cyclase-like protein/prenyltransferase/squalene oxidase-like repeat protein